jgi:hypothetical protein
MDSQLLYRIVTREVTVDSARLKAHKCRGRLDVVSPGDAARQYFLAPILVHLGMGRAELYRADLGENIHDSTSLPKRV